MSERLTVEEREAIRRSASGGYLGVAISRLLCDLDRSETEREQAEEELDRLEARLERVIEIAECSLAHDWETSRKAMILSAARGEG